MIKCRWFYAPELVSPDVYKRVGGNVWFLFDPRLLVTIDWARDVLGPLVANNWAGKPPTGTKIFTNRGFRAHRLSISAELSAHYRGQALDAHSPTKTPAECRRILIENADSAPHPFRLEDDVDWLHIDVANVDYGDGKVILFRG